MKLHPDRLTWPAKWLKKYGPGRVFICSMGDLFHELVPDEFLDRVFAVMAATQDMTFQVLTKRPKRMRDYMLGYTAREMLADGNKPRAVDAASADVRSMFTLPNVWLGTSVEDQRRADERIPLLLDTPAVVRWLSMEPLLAPVTLDPYVEQNGLHWVVVGGESGPGYRTMKLEWAVMLRLQCAAAGIPYFFKQISHARPGQGSHLIPVHEFPDEEPYASRLRTVHYTLVSGDSIGTYDPVPGEGVPITMPEHKEWMASWHALWDDLTERVEAERHRDADAVNEAIKKERQ